MNKLSRKLARSIPWQLVGLLCCLQTCSVRSQTADSSKPGETTSQNHDVSLVTQVLTPTGIQVDLPSMRPRALALSPDGRLLVAADNNQELAVVDSHSGKVRQRVSPPPDVRNNTDQSSTQRPIADNTGPIICDQLVFSPDGERIYLSNFTSSITIFGVRSDGHVTVSDSIDLSPAVAPDHDAASSGGLAISEHGDRLYVALNLIDRLAEINTTTGNILRIWNVGVAPCDIVLAGKKAYVSNWNGQRAGQRTGPIGQTESTGRGARLLDDRTNHEASDGSISIVDLTEKKRAKDKPEFLPMQGEIDVGPHPSAMAISPDWRYLVVDCADSDTVGVIDTHTEKLIETISVKLNPNGARVARPNSLVFDKKGKVLYVTNSAQNAVAVIRFRPGSSALAGLIPVGWFPGAIVCDTGQCRLYVANLKGTGLIRKGSLKEQLGRSTREYYGTLSLLTMPDEKELPTLTQRVLQNNQTQ